MFSETAKEATCQSKSKKGSVILAFCETLKLAATYGKITKNAGGYCHEKIYQQNQK